MTQQTALMDVADKQHPAGKQSPKVLAEEIDAQVHALPPNSKTEDVRAVRRKFLDIAS
jgi:hypothetical protein